MENRFNFSGVQDGSKSPLHRTLETMQKNKTLTNYISLETLINVLYGKKNTLFSDVF